VTARIGGLIRRRPVRLRLTLMYTSMFLLGGVALLAVSYALVASSLSGSVDDSQQTKAQLYSYKHCFAQPSKPQVLACQARVEEVAREAASYQRTQTLDRLLRYSAAALGACAVISAGLGWVMAGRVLRPVHAITAAARRASEENLGERIALTGPADELKELADTFDDMLARLNAAFASQRRFVANASHELRTPLTMMRTSIDVTLGKPDRTKEQLEAMAAEVRLAADRAETLIEALLTLARSDRGTSLKEPFDLAVYAEDALDNAVRALKERRIAIKTELDPGLAEGDPVLAERLVTNLIDNATRHNRDCGAIEITTGTTADGMAFIVVANDGDVIPQHVVPGLFEPFRRLAGRTGSPGDTGLGLGLSIVHSVVTAHHGTVRAEPRPAGGLVIRVEFPLAGPPKQTRRRQRRRGARRRSSSLPSGPDAYRAGRYSTRRQAA